MDNALLQRKLNHAFAQMDLDGNGFIEKDDVVGMGLKTIEHFGIDRSAPRAEAVVSAFDRLWDELATTFDADGDGRVSAEEYLSGFVSSLSDESKYADFFQPAVDATLNLGGSTREGTLNLVEWRTLQAAYGTAPEQADEAFRLLDKDASGLLTRDELTAAIHQFYLGTDPEAPGNHFFGPLGTSAN
ncbi:EF-hand domain-containing protein [Allokutzneria sp. NRRL B-24872]|uniref:EF-hand domain-containing protein n=1 Tax=Allokutzneria sp. NRRL B-24872 TaxID=1137961 RepID=UPI000A395A38|nr:EF-hand domain-containing protein [Allokutzneria sp. NRRL B-24872]